MFTGIVQGIGEIASIDKKPGLWTLGMRVPQGMGDTLVRGASVAIDGICLTVTTMQDDVVFFDAMQQTLQVTTLAELAVSDQVNLERAARVGDEIGGHLLSGHVDFICEIGAIEKPENNHIVYFDVPQEWQKYIFSKGYVSINGASLTIASVDKARGSFAVWLIPETLRATTFSQKLVGDKVNIEIDRTTQVIVDTVTSMIGGKVAEDMIRG